MSWQARRFKKKIKKERRHGQNKHHILPRARYGPTTADNLIWLKVNRHKVWHDVFGHLTFREAAELLLRAAEIIEKKGGDK